MAKKKLSEMLFDKEQKSDATNINVKKPTETPDVTDDEKEDADFMTTGEEVPYEKNGKQYKQFSQVTFDDRLGMMKNIGKDYQVPVTERYSKDGKTKDVKVGTTSAWDILDKHHNKSEDDTKVNPIPATGKWSEILNEKNEERKDNE